MKIENSSIHYLFLVLADAESKLSAHSVRTPQLIQARLAVHVKSAQFVLNCSSINVQD